MDSPTDANALYDLLQRIQSGDPDALQQVIDLGLFEDRAGLLGQKAKQGASMMGTPSAQGMSVGGTYVAASPLEHLATAMGRVMGNRQLQGAQGDMEELIKRKGKGLGAYLGSMAEAPSAPAWPGVPYPYPGE